ncbi:hypothetical protein AB0I49_02915 [Streptomyces sp. NPDC050617]|uniref:hypothetical protein n=1 Tax=Streptomyces sp. NPDC050617 TaxID=3154628 RepID=UPI003417CE1D
MPISTPHRSTPHRSARNRSARNRSARTAFTSAACALALTALLTACGGGGDEAKGDKAGGAGGADGVASIETGKPGAGAKSGSGKASSDSGRPRWRLDSSDEEIAAIWDRYYGCLKENGVRMNSERGHDLPAGPDGKVLPPGGKEEPKAAYTKCQNKMPQGPDVLDRKKNPKFDQMLAADVKCMQNKGLKVALGGEHGTDWSYTGQTTGLSTAEKDKIEKDCELEAFGGKH